MQKWEYSRVNSGKTITERIQPDALFPETALGKMTVWVVVSYYSLNQAAPELLFSQEIEFDRSKHEEIRGFRFALTERALAKLGYEGWESYHVYMDEDAVPVFFLKRPIPEQPRK